MRTPRTDPFGIRSLDRAGEPMPRLIGSANQRALLRLVIAVIFLFSWCLPVIAQNQSTSPPQATDSLFAKPFIGAAPDSSRPVLEHRDPRYRLCASDVISVTFPLTPEFDQTINIQPDGYASLSGTQEVHLEGLTTD